MRAAASLRNQWDIRGMENCSTNRGRAGPGFSLSIQTAPGHCHGCVSQPPPDGCCLQAVEAHCKPDADGRPRDHDQNCCSAPPQAPICLQQGGTRGRRVHRKGRVKLNLGWSRSSLARCKHRSLGHLKGWHSRGHVHVRGNSGPVSFQAFI